MLEKLKQGETQEKNQDLVAAKTTERALTTNGETIIDDMAVKVDETNDSYQEQ
jgi:hypothetical protein